MRRGGGDVQGDDPLVGKHRRRPGESYWHVWRAVRPVCDAPRSTFIAAKVRPWLSARSRLSSHRGRPAHRVTQGRCYHSDPTRFRLMADELCACSPIFQVTRCRLLKRLSLAGGQGGSRTRSAY